jgi:hypothetical protein
MKVLSVHKGQDTGGQGWRMTDAFRRLAPDWSFRSAYAPNAFFYLDYPKDIDPWDGPLVAKLWKDADVIHLHNNFRTAEILERANGVRHYSYAQPGKKTVIHYHGTTFRAKPEVHIAQQKQRKATGLVSTLDLWLLAPDDTEWLPAPYHLDWLKTFRKPGKTLRIGHAPTERGVKDTDSFLAAVERLQGEGHQIELDLIEGVKWSECLERKGRCDIYYDQVLLGYGCNAIEAWGMGIPVIAGGAPDTLAEMTRRFGDLPFYRATKATIYDALLALMDKDTRSEYASRGEAHVRQFHDDAKVIEQLQDVYRRAAA